MTLWNKAVAYDAANNKHVPLAAGDLIDAANILSTDAANAATRGSDGGVFVTAQVIFPDDQVMTGGSTTSTNTTLTPVPQPNNDVNYQVTVDAKISASSGNQLVIDSTGLFVPPAELAASTIPSTTTNDGSTPTLFIGGNTYALGTPQGWANVVIAGVGVRKIPYYAV